MADLFGFDTHLLFFTALVTVAMQLTFFFIAASFKFDKVTDFAGGSNFVLLAWLTYLINGTFYWRQTMVTLAVTAWGARLSGYLLYRILKIGKDDRFDGTREDFCKFLAFWVYQMFWVWTVSLPVTFLNTTAANPGLDARDVAGAAMFVAGLLVEAVADQQKFSFKSTPGNRGKYCDTGSWSWSRHPNYFGEILLWWGLFTVSSSVFNAAKADSDGAWGYATIAGPIFTTLILLFVSGIPPLEASYDEKYGTQVAYQQWKARTSCLVPCPPGLYKSLPEIAKKVLFFEWYGAGSSRLEEQHINRPSAEEDDSNH